MVSAGVVSAGACVGRGRTSLNAYTPTGGLRMLRSVCMDLRRWKTTEPSNVTSMNSVNTE